MYYTKRKRSKPTRTGVSIRNEVSMTIPALNVQYIIDIQIMLKNNVNFHFLNRKYIYLIIIYLFILFY